MVIGHREMPQILFVSQSLREPKTERNKLIPIKLKIDPTVLKLSLSVK